MESTVEVRSEEKRPPEDAEVEGEPAAKKAKRGVVSGDVKKVAELVLVLAAMGKMRGGRSPTDAEKEMMLQARDKLGEVCQLFAPKDVFPRDAFGSVIEDLGLNKLKEQRLGFRTPKMSIAEKLLLSKRKMEKPEEFTLQSAQYASQRMQPNSGTTVETRATANAARMFPADKPGHAPISSGNFHSALTMGHGSTANSAPLTYQLPTSDIKPVTHSGLATGNLSKDISQVAMPRVERPHFKADGRSNGASHNQAASGDHSALRPPNWSMAPPHSAAKLGPENGVPAQSASRVEGGADHKLGMSHQVTTSRPFSNQSSSVNLPNIHQHIHGLNTVPTPPPSNTHAEIGKIVQRFLQPHLPGRHAWIPPSRDYMSKAVTCQMCKSTATEVDSVLVCDACEKGYHLKCLQMSNQKGIPRGEWHCGRCLSLTNGKPIPPKYGRVMRNVNAPKVSSNASSAQPSLDKREREKATPQKVSVNGNATLHNLPSVGTANRVDSASFQTVDSVKEMPENDTISNNRSADGKVSSESFPNSLKKTVSDSSAPPVGSSVDKPCQAVAVELKQQPPAETSVYKREVEEANTADSSMTHSGHTNCNSSSGHLHAVEWVGNKLSAGDEKSYYDACRINGCVYNLEDYALIRFENDRLVPSKLQTMWEDAKTGNKWVTVNRCYFPRELPASVGRPCSLENSEVYLSNFCTSVLAGLIEGPCEVLPPSKFTEERELRTLAETKKNDSVPLYLCKWIFDEAKGLFRDVSC